MPDKILRFKTKVTFHGGCQGCTQHEIHDADFCFDCRYFDTEWDKPDLNNKPESLGDVIRREVRKRRTEGDQSSRK